MSTHKLFRAETVKLLKGTGAALSFEHTGGSHQVAVIMMHGRRRKVFFGTSASDRRALANHRTTVRRALRELQAVKPVAHCDERTVCDDPGCASCGVLAALMKLRKANDDRPYSPRA